MTENISEEELLLIKRARRRLVGAITLVIAAVIILPLIFDEEPEVKQEEIAILFPAEAPMDESAPQRQFNDELTSDSLDEEMQTGKDELEPLPFKAVAPKEIVAEPVKKLEKQNNVPVPATKPQKKSIAIKEEQIQVKQSPSSEMQVFVVQLGAFSDHSKARNQQQNLVSHGIKAYTETSMTNEKEMMRVRVGPFSTRSAAEQELVKLRKLGLDGVVTAK